MIITISLWAIPAIITFVSFIIATIINWTEDGDLFGVMPLFTYGAATIVSLASWAIYGLLT